MSNPVETYYVVEFGEKFYSFGGRYETEQDAKTAAPGKKKLLAKDADGVLKGNVRIVKVTREVLK